MGYYLNPDDETECLECDPTCETCFGGEANECITCKHGGYITIEQTCECYSGPVHEFDPEPDASNCEIVCEHNCAACDEWPWNCTECVDGTEPVDGDCGCPEGYVRVPEQT